MRWKVRWRTWVEIHCEDLMAEWELATTDMKEDDFKILTASVEEAGRIKAGKMASSKITEIQPTEVQEVGRNVHISQEARVPNAETVAAMGELEEGKGKSFGSVDELLVDLSTDD